MVWEAGHTMGNECRDKQQMSSYRLNQWSDGSVPHKMRGRKGHDHGERERDSKGSSVPRVDPILKKISILNFIP